MGVRKKKCRVNFKQGHLTRQSSISLLRYRSIDYAGLIEKTPSKLICWQSIHIKYTVWELFNTDLAADVDYYL